MQHFTRLADVPSLGALLNEALRLKQNPQSASEAGRFKTLGLLFFNPSLRTRMSTQKAAFNLGMDVMVMNIDKDGWQIETREGAVMNGDKAEHVKDAVGVMGQYCDLIGVRSFAGLQNREEDYAEPVLNQFLQYAGVPVLSLESATRHPLQSLADLMSIEEHKTRERPKVVLTWAPHPKALPQAVANSFLEWTAAAGYEVVLTHPEGYELAEEFLGGGVRLELDRNKALEGADFVYAKNWSSYRDYGRVLNQDPAWTLTEADMQKTNQAFFMHCLPVRRNVVVSDAVIDSPRSLVLNQALNRVFAAQAVLKTLLDNS